MRRYFSVLFFVTVLLALPVGAAEITVSSQDCEMLPPSAVVASADYVPGIDVEGKPVIGADLNAGAVTPPTTIKIPLALDIPIPGQSPNIPAGRPFGRFDSKADLGSITYDAASNKLQFNGQDLPQNADAAIRGACSRITIQ